MRLSASINLSDMNGAIESGPTSSLIADVRIIWEAIIPLRMLSAQRFLQDHLIPRCRSLFVLCTQCRQTVVEPKIDDLARGFYNDTHLFDQNACTAPHLVVY